MKNTYTSSRKSIPGQIIVTLIGRSAAMAGAFFLLISSKSPAQDGLPPHQTCAGISLRTEISADGYGGKYLPGLFISKGRSYYGLNAVIQTRNSNLAGFQFNYNYALTGEPVNCDRSEPELFLSCSMSYNHKGMLGKAALRNEAMANPDAGELDLQNACFRSVEFFAGFGLKLELCRNLKWSNSIGLGGYASLQTPVQGLFYQSNGVGIRLSSGFSYAFN